MAERTPVYQDPATGQFREIGSTPGDTASTASIPATIPRKADANTWAGVQTFTGVGNPSVAEFSGIQHAHTSAGQGGRLGPDAMLPRPTRVVDARVSDTLAIANDATEQLYANSAAVAATVWAVGAGIRAKFAGKFSTTGTPTLTLRLKEGVGSTTLLSLGARTLGAGVANKTFEVDALLLCTATGATGTLRILASVTFDGTVYQLPVTDVTFDTTANNTLRLSAQWSAADPANTTLLHLILLEALS